MDGARCPGALRALKSVVRLTGGCGCVVGHSSWRVAYGRFAGSAHEASPPACDTASGPSARPVPGRMAGGAEAAGRRPGATAARVRSDRWYGDTTTRAQESER